MQDVIELNLTLAELRMLMDNEKLSRPLMEYLQRRHNSLLDMQLRTVKLTGAEIEVIKVGLNNVDSELPEYHSALRKLEV